MVSDCAAQLAHIIMHPEQSCGHNFSNVCLLDIATSGWGKGGAYPLSMDGCVAIVVVASHHHAHTEQWLANILVTA